MYKIFVAAAWPIILVCMQWFIRCTRYCGCCMTKYTGVHARNDLYHVQDIAAAAWPSILVCMYAMIYTMYKILRLLHDQLYWCACMQWFIPCTRYCGCCMTNYTGAHACNDLYHVQDIAAAAWPSILVRMHACNDLYHVQDIVHACNDLYHVKILRLLHDQLYGVHVCNANAHTCLWGYTCIRLNLQVVCIYFLGKWIIFWLSFELAVLHMV